MITDISEIYYEHHYNAMYNGKELSFKFVKSYFDPLGHYEILKYEGKTGVPDGLREKILKELDEIDFGNAELL